MCADRIASVCAYPGQLAPVLVIDPSDKGPDQPYPMLLKVELSRKPSA